LSLFKNGLLAFTIAVLTLKKNLKSVKESCIMMQKSGIRINNYPKQAKKK